MLAAHPDSPLQGLGLFGVVKETGVDDVGLAEFATQFFPFPIYCDKSYTFYHALGDRKMSVDLLSFLNPLSVFSFLSDAYRRITSKQIGGNFKGEGVVQGGIILFNNDGYPAHAYQEETGTDIPLRDILLAVHEMKIQATIHESSSSTVDEEDEG